jgi:hypothetical protein
MSDGRRISPNPAAAQKRGSSSPAFIAPGIATMIRLSTISITVIEKVSEASASGNTAASTSPERRSGSIVKEYPNRKAKRIARTIVNVLLSPAAVPIAKPITSPIAQPVRQWAVAEVTVRLRDVVAEWLWLDTHLLQEWRIRTQREPSVSRGPQRRRLSVQPSSPDNPAI